MTFGEPDNIEPVPPPPFAIMGRSEQPIHEPLVGVGPAVLQELLHFSRRGGQADEIERQPPQERLANCD